MRLLSSVSPSQLGVQSTQSSKAPRYDPVDLRQKPGFWREHGLPRTSIEKKIRTSSSFDHRPLGSSYVDLKTQHVYSPSHAIAGCILLPVPRGCSLPLDSFSWSSRGRGCLITVAYSGLSRLSTEDHPILIRRYPSISWVIMTDSALRPSYT